MHAIADIIGFCPDRRKLYALDHDGVVLESSPQFSQDPGITPFTALQETDPKPWGFLVCKKATINPNWQAWFPCELQLTLVQQEEIRWKTKTKIGYPYRCADKHA
jgi:hypothetical protein